LSNVYLLPIVCPVSCETNVSSISGLSILDCLSVLSNVYLLPIVCPVSCVTNVSSFSGLSVLDCLDRQSRMDNPEILETLVSQDTGHTIGSK
jgi:hypothetical protein